MSVVRILEKDKIMSFLRMKITRCVVLLAALAWVLAVGGNIAIGQTNERLYATNPNDKGPPADDPNEPDVAKRPRFLWTLGRQRLPLGGSGIRSLESLHNYERWKDTPIPEERKQALLRIATTVLLSDFHPPDDLDSVRWYGMWTSVAHRDADENLISWESKLSWVRADWEVGDYTIRAGGGITIRLPKRSELAFRPEPPDFEGYDWEFLSKSALWNVLSEFFVLPFDSVEDFGLRGHLKHLAGVDVFVGEIRPPAFVLRDGKPVRVREEDILWTTKPYPRRILITDSDPQYLCVGFSFPKDE
jgi:hypothetical protein